MQSFGPLTDPSSLRLETKHDELTTSRHFQTPGQMWTLVSCVLCEQPVYASGCRRSDDEAPPSPHFAVVFNAKLLVNI